MACKPGVKEVRIRVQPHHHKWLKAEAKKNGGSIAAEVSRAVAERIERKTLATNAQQSITT